MTPKTTFPAPGAHHIRFVGDWHLLIGQTAGFGHVTEREPVAAIRVAQPIYRAFAEIWEQKRRCSAGVTMTPWAS